MIHPIGNSHNGVAVYIDLIHSDAAEMIRRQPYLLAFIAEVLPSLTLRSASQVVEHDMGRPIGYESVKETSAGELIFYAKPVKDDVYSRFVKNIKPPASSHLTIYLERDDSPEAAYQVRDVKIGHSSPPRPGSAEETTLSKTFWGGHAYVFDGQALQSQTITKECPY